MYVRQRTWIERGPGLGLVASLRRARPARRRGMGEYPGDPCYDPGRPSLLPYWISSGQELACVLGSGAAGWYERIQYGKIPRPADLPAPPVAPAPQTAAQLAGDWWPEAAAVSPEQWEAWKASQRAAIVAAEQSGEYNPAGNLPVTASGLSDFFSRYGTALAVAGVALVGVVAVAGVRR